MKTRMDLINELTEAFACALGGFRPVNEAVAAFTGIGERVTGITLHIAVDTEELPAVRVSGRFEPTHVDAEFLKSLNISVAPSERPSE